MEDPKSTREDNNNNNNHKMKGFFIVITTAMINGDINFIDAILVPDDNS